MRSSGLEHDVGSLTDSRYDRHAVWSAFAEGVVGVGEHHIFARSLHSVDIVKILWLE